MATAAGYDFFANALVNQQLRKILGYWADFLQSPVPLCADRSVSPLDRQTLIVPWLGEVAKREMVQVAQGRSGPATTPPQSASRGSSTPCRERNTRASPAGTTSSPAASAPACGR